MHRSSRGLATQTVIGAIVPGSLFGSVLYWRSSPRATPASSEQLALLSHRLGLTPDAMAASGFGATQTHAAMNNLHDHSGELIAALASADQEYSEALAERDRLAGRIRAGAGSREDVAALAGAESRLAAARASRSAWITATVNQAAETAGSASLSVLHTIRDSRRFDDAVSLSAAARDQEDMVRLRDALAVEREALASGQAVPDDAAQILATERASAAVATAAANYTTNFAAVSEAWNGVVGGP